MRPGIAYSVSQAQEVICTDLASNSAALIQQATQLKIRISEHSGCYLCL